MQNGLAAAAAAASWPGSHPVVITGCLVSPLYVYDYRSHAEAGREPIILTQKNEELVSAELEFTRICRLRSAVS